MRWEKETDTMPTFRPWKDFLRIPILFPFSEPFSHLAAGKIILMLSNPSIITLKFSQILPRVFKVKCLTKINLTFKDGGFWTASTSATGIWELKFGNTSPPTGLYLRIVYLHKDNTLSTEAQRDKAFLPWFVYFYSFIQTTSIYRALPLHWALYQALEITEMNQVVVGEVLVR